MIAPSADAKVPPPGGDDFHRRLSDRSTVLPPGGNEDGRIGLSDAMLGLAVLACCFALARLSIAIGIAALVIAVPSLARTHVVMIRHRDEGISPGLGRWVAAFAGSTLRATFALALCALAYWIGLAGCFTLVHHACEALGGPLAIHQVIIGVVVGFALAAVMTVPILVILVPRLLAVREGT